MSAGGGGFRRRSGVTNPYQSPNLGAGLPSMTFTNLYHRDDTTHTDIHIVASIGHQGTGWAGWHRVITVDNGGGPYTHSERVGTVVVGIAKKNLFSIRPVGL